MTDTEKIRILIVDDIADTRENLAKLIGFEPDLEIAGMAAGGQQAIDMAKRERPNVILTVDCKPGRASIGHHFPVRRSRVACRPHDPLDHGDELAEVQFLLDEPPRLDDLAPLLGPLAPVGWPAMSLESMLIQAANANPNANPPHQENEKVLVFRYLPKMPLIIRELV